MQPHEAQSNPDFAFAKSELQIHGRIASMLGYLGGFIGPLPLIATTAGILVAQWRRQFASESSAAVSGA
jgi:uncharacterized membrane protein